MKLKIIIIVLYIISLQSCISIMQDLGLKSGEYIISDKIDLNSSYKKYTPLKLNANRKHSMHYYIFLKDGPGSNRDGGQTIKGHYVLSLNGKEVREKIFDFS